MACSNGRKLLIYSYALHTDSTKGDEMTAAQAHSHDGAVFDVYAGRPHQFRVASNLSREELARYCAARGCRIESTHRRSVRYFDAFIVRAESRAT